jgi:excisionase family DNA binding protein
LGARKKMNLEKEQKKEFFVNILTAAKRLGISKRLVYTLIRQEKISYIRVTNKYLVNVDEFIDKNKVNLIQE